MIPREKRIKVWFLIKKVAVKLGVRDIPKEVEENYWADMKVPNENVRYLLVDYNNLDTDFFYHSYEESDLKGTNEAEKMKEMFEKYFASIGDENTFGQTLLLIDIKTLKPYTLTKEIKYNKKVIL